MSFTDTRAFVAELERRGELTRVSASVSRELEITEIADRLVKAGGPAVLFENVEGSPFPLLIGAFGTRERTALALGVADLNELSERVRELLKFEGLGKPSGLLRQLPKLKHLGNLRPRLAKNAPVHEVIWQGDEVDLHKIPVLKCWPKDGGPFVTLPLVITKDPETGEHNMGMYRMQIFDAKSTGMHWQRHKTGTKHLQKAKERGEKLPVAVALGGDPVLTYAATAPIPPLPGVDEYSLAGYLRGAPYPVARGVHTNLLVPANAEFILEGYVDPEEPWVTEGPFGDHTGFYTLPEPYPRFHVTAITMRRRPIYPATIVGRPPMEDAYLIEASERIFLPPAQLILPEITDYHMPPQGVAHNLVSVAIKKEYPGQAYKVANGLFGLGQMMNAKVIAVVDEGTPLTDTVQMWRTVAEKAMPGRDTLHGRGPIDVLDHASRGWGFGGKLIIDATTKRPEEIGSGVHSRANQAHDTAPERWMAKVASVPLPQHEGILEQRQTSEGFWLVKATNGSDTAMLGELLAKHEAAAGMRHLLFCDDETDLGDHNDVWWTVLNNIDAERDTWACEGSGGPMLVWDGLRKIGRQQVVRPWPEKIHMDESTKAKVSARWAEYGLD